MRKDYAVRTALAAVLVSMTVVIGGCVGETGPNGSAAGWNEQSPSPAAGSGSASTGSKIVPNEPTGTPSDGKPPGSNGGALQTASSNQTANGSGGDNGSQSGAAGDKSSTASSSDQGSTDPKTTPPLDAYSVKQPSLMGVKLTDNTSTVKLKLGFPQDEYTMEDAQDPITVYEYNGYSVGFNRAGVVQFVEITSEDIDPGLNGLRLKQNVKQALQALGKPDISSKYALSFKSGGTVLKLDVDPTLQTILSIKLFADTEQ
ncbi:hypothetical protein [Paenibacillus koleovorans]|uniref:hypothetical protein n=1 Tax=Paenibacillus koleovorans TaxID=121608 RepID=UPI000FD83A80|nr:hypothetical protein [Paenibacillus koleovorans]